MPPMWLVTRSGEPSTAMYGKARKASPYWHPSSSRKTRMIPAQGRSSRASGSCMSLISPRPKGNHLPEPPNWKSPEQNAILSQRLIDFARQKGISVTVKKLDGNTQGLSRGGEIELGSNCRDQDPDP